MPAGRYAETALRTAGVWDSLGERVLRAWKFPEAHVVAAHDAEEWWRDPGPDPEYADLVVVSQAIGAIGTPAFNEMPPLVRLPAFAKVSGGWLDPQRTMALIDEAAEQIAELKALLRG